MSRLTIYAEDAPQTVLLTTADPAAIAEGLAEIGVSFERWAADADLAPDADDAAVLAAYASDIARLEARGGYRSMDVVRMKAGTPAPPGVREKFLSEHTHADDEVRFFVEGAAQFYLHGGGKVFILTCEADDLISVPAGTTHWFDMGPLPHFTAIRLFVTPAGWVAEYTGSTIADRFSKFEPVT